MNPIEQPAKITRGARDPASIDTAAPIAKTNRGEFRLITP